MSVAELCNVYTVLVCLSGHYHLGAPVLCAYPAPRSGPLVLLSNPQELLDTGLNDDSY